MKEFIENSRTQMKSVGYSKCLFNCQLHRHSISHPKPIIAQSLPEITVLTICDTSYCLQPPLCYQLKGISPDTPCDAGFTAQKEDNVSPI